MIKNGLANMRKYLYIRKWFLILPKSLTSGKFSCPWISHGFNRLPNESSAMMDLGRQIRFQLVNPDSGIVQFGISWPYFDLAQCVEFGQLDLLAWISIQWFKSMHLQCPVKYSKTRRIANPEMKINWKLKISRLFISNNAKSFGPNVSSFWF